MLLGNFDEDRSNVKSFVRIRKGRRTVVKQYTRKKKPKKTSTNNVVRNTALGVAGVLGLSAATYMGLKVRYIKNLDNIAKNLKVTKVHPPTDKSMLTFSIGGFGYADEAWTEPKRQSEVIGRLISKWDKKQSQEVIPIWHNVQLATKPKNKVEHARMMFATVFEPVAKGNNAHSEKLIQEIYDYAQSNPNKPINIASFSGGGNFSRDIDYVLRKKGIVAKYATTGSADFRMIPGKRNNFLNINSKSDGTYIVRSPNTIDVNEVENHRPDSFYRNKKVRKLVSDFFYS
jgi:hypothetical protein